MLNRFNIKRIINQPKLIIIALSSLNPVRKFSFLLHSKDIHSSDTFDRETILEYNQHRKYGIRKSICYAANNNLYFDIYGNVFLCCYNRKYILGNVANNSIKEIWESKKRKDAVKDFKNNNLTDGCAICHNNIQQKNYGNSMSMSFDLFHSEQDDYPVSMDFECSNVCNLECVMCNGEFSNLIRKNRENRESVKNPYSSKFMSELKPYLKHLKYANFLGGEPQLIKLYFAIWQELIRNNRALIRVQTNGVVLSKNFIELLNSNQFQIALSIDAINDREIFNKIRINGNFDEFIHNINFYKQLFLNGIIDLTVSICPMTLNIDEIIYILDFCNKNNIVFSFNYVINPYYLSLKNASTEQLIKLKENLTYYLNKEYEFMNKNNSENIKHLIKLINSYIATSISNKNYLEENLKKTIIEVKQYLHNHLNIIFQKTDINIKLGEKMMDYVNSYICDLEENLQKLIMIKLTFNSTHESNHEFYEKDIDLYKSILIENINGFIKEYYDNQKNNL